MKRQIGEQWWQVVVDKHDKTPPYLQIAATIRHKIATGELAPGSSLPSVRQLMKIAGVTSTTVTRSYHLLQEEGLISIQQGVGAIVQEAHKLSSQRTTVVPERLVDEVDDLIHRILQQGVGADALLRTLKSRLHKATASRYVIYTTAEAVVSEHYANVITQELAQVGVRCIPISLATLLRLSDETAALIEGAEHVFTALPIFREVQERVGSVADTPVSHLLTQVTLASHERLQAIKPEQRVALFVQRRYRSSGHGLMLTYVTPEQLTLVRSFTKASVEAAIAEADVIIHTVGTRKHVQSAPNLTGREIIELEYAIRPDVLDTVRDLL